MTRHKLIIEPGIYPGARHQIEDTLTGLGFKILGGGGCLDGTSSDISFESTDQPGEVPKSTPKPESPKPELSVLAKLYDETLNSIDSIVADILAVLKSK